MGKIVLTDCRVEVNAVVISDHCSEVTIESEIDEVEQTGFGASMKEINQGLGDGTITLQAFSDYQAGSIDSQMSAIHFGRSAVVIKVRPTTAAISTSNPEYVMTGKLFTFNPIAGSVGESATTPLTFRNSAPAGIVRNVS